MIKFQMSADHPRKQMEAILSSQWEKNVFALPRTLLGQMMSMSSFTMAAVPFTGFSITSISEEKGQI